MAPRLLLLVLDVTPDVAALVRDQFQHGHESFVDLSIDRDPIFRAQLGTDTRLARLVHRMLRDVEGQRERARQRGLLELDSRLSPAK